MLLYRFRTSSSAMLWSGAYDSICSRCDRTYTACCALQHNVVCSKCRCGQIISPQTSTSGYIFERRTMKACTWRWRRCWPLFASTYCSSFVGDGGRGGTCPPKIRKKNFSGNFCVKFGHFSGKNHVKLEGAQRVHISAKWFFYSWYIALSFYL